MSENSKVSPAVLEAKKQRDQEEKGDIMVLDSGVRVRVKQVPPGLLQDVVSHIEEPSVPTWYNEDKGRNEPNPNSPDYIKALQKYEEEQSLAMLDVIALFGLELVDGLPEDKSWIRKLKIIARRSKLDLSDYDLDDEIDVKFLYIRFIALAGSDYIKLGQVLSGISEGDVSAAQNMFPGDEGRSTDNGGAAQAHPENEDTGNV